MTHRAWIQAALAKAAAAMSNYDDGFSALERVDFDLDPSTPGHQEQIDAITCWGLDSQRFGRVRRKVDTENSLVTFYFENVTDAVECSLRFR